MRTDELRAVKAPSLRGDASNQRRKNLDGLRIGFERGDRENRKRVRKETVVSH